MTSSLRTASALPAGAPRYSSTDDIRAEIRASWNAMSREEKAEASADLVAELNEVKEMKALSVQSVPISAFHDVRASMDIIFEEVRFAVARLSRQTADTLGRQLRRLHARTGLEVALIAVKSERTQYTPPMTFGTSKRVHDFFQLSLDSTLDDISASFEAYCMSGVKGTRSGQSRSHHADLTIAQVLSSAAVTLFKECKAARPA